jgi:hypothetical protein
MYFTSQPDDEGYIFLHPNPSQNSVFTYEAVFTNRLIIYSSARNQVHSPEYES